MATAFRMFLGRQGPRVQATHRTLSKREPNLRLVFVGDILPLLFRRADFEPAVIELFARADLAIGNLEGVISDRPWFPFLQKHDPRILQTLERLAPLPRWILSLANNHAGDYGPVDFSRTASLVDRMGARFVGTIERPRLVLAPKVTLTAWTEWSNRTAPWVQTQNPSAPGSPELHIAFPHFGHEFERAPRPHTAPDGYELVVGHHPHFPQPIEQRRHQLIAWSLGNFLTEVRLRSMSEGLVLGVDIDTNGDRPSITAYRATPISIDRSNETLAVVRRDQLVGRV